MMLELIDAVLLAASSWARQLKSQMILSIPYPDR